MFSSRVALAPVNVLAAELLACRDRSESIIDLTLSNPCAIGGADGFFPGRDKQLYEAICCADIVRYEPDPQGMLHLREHIAQDAKRGPEDVFITASTSESYSWLFQLLCDPGDEVLVPQPSYPLFAQLASLHGVRLCSYPLQYAGEWLVDFYSLVGRAGPRTRALVLVNPNNPTGNFINQGDARRFEMFCAERGLALISDEVFFRYPLAEDPGRYSFLETTDCLSFVLDGLSKRAALPHIKIGWMFLGGPRSLRQAARERLSLIADTYLSASYPMQSIATKLYDIGETSRPRLVEHIRSNYRLIRQCAAQSSITPLVAEGGWSVILRLPAIADENDIAMRLLREQRIFVHPGFYYDITGHHLVLSLLSDSEHIWQLVNVLRAWGY